MNAATAKSNARGGNIRLRCRAVAAILTIVPLFVVAPKGYAGPQSKEIKEIYPVGGLAIPPETTFTVEFTGAGYAIVDATLTNGAGDTVALGELETVVNSNCREVFRWTPTEPLEDGTYEFEAELEKNGSNATQSRSYEVDSSMAVQEVAEPEQLRFSWLGSDAKNEGDGGGCWAEGEYYSRIQFDYPKERLSDVEYFVVEARSAHSEPKTIRAWVPPSHVGEDGSWTREDPLPFAPDCVTVEAFSRGRIHSANQSTCEANRCNSDSPQKSLPIRWSVVPECDEQTPTTDDVGSDPDASSTTGGDATLIDANGSRSEDENTGTLPWETGSDSGGCSCDHVDERSIVSNFAMGGVFLLLLLVCRIRVRREYR